MNKVTLGQVWEIIVWVAGAIGVLSVIVGLGIKVHKIFKRNRHNEISEIVKTAISSEMTPMNSEISNLKDAVKANELGSCKNFLVRFLADVEQGQAIDEIELERFYEVYGRYTSPELDGNSYIHEKVERLKAQGKL